MHTLRSTGSAKQSLHASSCNPLAPVAFPRAGPKQRRLSPRHDLHKLRHHSRAGFTYSNQLLFYYRNESKDQNGDTKPVTGNNTVLMDMNSIIWVSKRKILGGANYSALATLPFAGNDLTTDIHGNISGGAGFADSYYVPFILGWNKERVSIRLLYGFLAPTGRYASDASNNVGSGYWTNAISSGQTFSLTHDQNTGRSPPSRCTSSTPRRRARKPTPARPSISTTRWSATSPSPTLLYGSSSASPATRRARPPPTPAPPSHPPSPPTATPSTPSAPPPRSPSPNSD